MSRLRPAGRAVFAVLVALSLLLAGLTASPAAAAGPLAIPAGPLPSGELKPVELSFIAVDATLTPSANGAALDVRTRAGLHNPDRKATFQRQVTFAGPAAADVRVGPLTGSLMPAGNAGPWTLALPPMGDTVIEASQRLDTGGPLADLQFDWGALKPWGERLNAVRLSLHFPGGLESGQLLIAEPAPTARDTLQLTWSYEKLPPAGTVRVLVVAPAAWQALRSARQAAAGPQAGAPEHLALAEALRPLAQAQGMPVAVATALRAELLAALEHAVAAAPTDPRPHKALGDQLRAQAGGDPALLARAVAELKAAYDLAGAAPASAGAVLEPPLLRQELLAAVDELLAACRQAGDTQGILRALDVAQAVDSGNSAERAAAYVDLAVRLLDAGRQAEAEATITAGFGAEALERYALHRPHFRSVTGDVETRSGARTMRFSLVPAPGMRAAADADLALLIEALSRAGGQVQRTDRDDAFDVEVTIPFADTESLRADGQAAMGSLPREADPAVRLVMAVAAPTSLGIQTEQGTRVDRLAYMESASLAPAQEALQQRLDQLAWSLSEAEATSNDPVEAARRRWALALLRRYQADWQALVRGCRVTYRLQLPENIVAPQWALAWGEARQLAWSTQIPRPERLWPVGVGAVVVVLGLAVVMGVARRRR